MEFGNPISSILRRVTRKSESRLSILTWSTHERYDVHLSKLNADFYILDGNGVRKWNESYSKIPDNFHFIKQVPTHLSFDCIISGNPFVHIPLAIPISKQLQIPIINIFHTDSPLNVWTKEVFNQNRGLFDECDHHVFISDFNKISWHFKEEKNTTVIEHGIDTELFSPGNLDKENVIISVANDFIGRDPELGFSLWRAITQGLPVKPIGNTPGLSKPAQSLQDLVRELQSSKIFLNTSLRSPVPMSLLEAFSCGLGVVTTNTCAIPDFAVHGENCLIFSPNAPEKGREYLIKLLQDDGLCQYLGNNARKTIEERFKMGGFLGKWKNTIEKVILEYSAI